MTALYGYDAAKRSAAEGVNKVSCCRDATQRPVASRLDVRHAYRVNGGPANGGPSFAMAAAAPSSNTHTHTHTHDAYSVPENNPGHTDPLCELGFSTITINLTQDSAQSPEGFRPTENSVDLTTFRHFIILNKSFKTSFQNPYQNALVARYGCPRLDRHAHASRHSHPFNFVDPQKNYQRKTQILLRT